MAMGWKIFKNDKPPRPGSYLWALNNWDVRNASGKRTHSDSVRLYHWNGSGFIEESHEIKDPDEWAEVLRPKKLDRPTDGRTEKPVVQIVGASPGKSTIGPVIIGMQEERIQKFKAAMQEFNEGANSATVNSLFMQHFIAEAKEKFKKLLEENNAR